MKIRTANANDVLERAQQQRYVSKEELLKRAFDCLPPQVCDSIRELADSYKHGEKIDIDVTSALFCQAYRRMVGADGHPVSVSRLRFGLASAHNFKI